MMKKWSEERKQFHKIKGTYKNSLQRKEKLRKASIERFKYEPGTFSGKKHTRKTKLKLRKINKGKIQSLETVQKRSKSMQTLHLRRPVEWIQKQKEHLRHIVQLQQEKFLKEGMEISILRFNNKPVSIELPIKIELKVTEAPPDTKGNSGGNVTKPVTLETGLVVDAPMFIKEGDTLRIDTRSGEYVERASQ